MRKTTIKMILISHEREYERIDEKHFISHDKIFKNNGIAIPDDEPRILFRGRDKLALPMLQYYRDLCVKDGCTAYQLASIDTMIKEFEDFSGSPTMKQPGITKGK